MTTTLTALLERLSGENGAHPTDIPELTVYRATEPSTPSPCIAPASLCVIAQGSKLVQLGDATYRYDPDHFLLVSAALPIAAHVIDATATKPYLSLSLTLDPALVCELAAQIQREPQPTPISAIAVSSVESPLLDAVTRFVALCEAPRDRAMLAPLIMREIVYRLLTGEQAARMRQLGTGDGTGQRIVRAIGWLREHFAEPVRIEDLAREVKLSPSALHQHFKSVTTLSPLQYQKQLRLHEARRLMLSGLEAAEACFQVGYESPSQFSREYRRLFGAPPRRDIATTRNQPPAALAADQA
ncbi:MAG: AraC family transcriptional regulator [Polyangiales bacterium]